jgi:hypothetical protein
MAATVPIAWRVAVQALARLLTIAVAVFSRPVGLPNFELTVIGGEEGKRARAALPLELRTEANV